MDFIYRCFLFDDLTYLHSWNYISYTSSNLRTAVLLRL